MKKPAAFANESDGELLRLGRAGQEDAFLMLYQRRHAAVFRFAVHMSGSGETAQEVVQEVFLALLSGSAGYREELGTLGAFLIGMARNQVRRQFRKRRQGDGQADELEDRFATAQTADTLCRESDLDALRKAVLALPERYRVVTVLCDLEELSYAETAERIGCAVGTVRSRLHRARAILGAKLRRRERCLIATIR